MDQLSFGEKAGVELVKRGSVAAQLLDSLRGDFTVEHYRKGKLIKSMEFKNAIVNEGKNFLLDTMFHAVSPLTTWYLGLIDLSGFTSLNAADIYDNINQSGNGWDEFDDYTDPANADSAVTRPVWTEGAAASQSITNSSVVVFDITATGTVKGIFLCAGSSAATKGDHTAGTGHKLWTTALFNAGDTDVENGDQLKITYTVSC